MKYLTEYRNLEATRQVIGQIENTVTRPWKIMEICGGQTHSILKSGLDTLLPPEVTLIHGPGCPVCVTPVSYVDHALALAARPEVTLTTFGDLMRVPSSSTSLERAPPSDPA